jgi:MFS family permease
VKRYFILLLSSSFSSIAYSVVAPMYPFFAKEIGGSMVDVGLLFATFNLSAAIFSIVGGRVEDKFKAHIDLFLFLSLLLFSFILLLHFFASSLYQLYILSFLEGIGSGFFWPGFESAYASSIAGREERMKWGFLGSAYNISLLLGSSMSGFIASLFGIRYIFLFASLFSLIAALVLLHSPGSFKQEPYCHGKQ